MNIKNTVIVCLGSLLLLGLTNFVNPAWQSKFVQETNGKLIYYPDSRGDRIPDFSKVGYHKGEVKIPDVGIVKTIAAPEKGDAQELIQNTIDEVANMPLNKSGFRGAILLKKGIYRIPGTIKITVGGIMLRGEGADEQGTILIASGKGQRTLINISGSSSSIELKDTKVAVTDPYVPVGSFNFHVEDAKNYHVGDLITLQRSGNEKWIHDLKMDQIVERPGTKQWKANEYNLKFERVITRIEGNKITIDQPIVMAIDKEYGGGLIYQIMDARISENGVENILFKSDFSSETDEDHGWYAIQFQNCENGWVKNVVAKYFGNGCVTMAGSCKYITVTDSKCLEAKSIITGGRRYSFNINGQMCLVMNCATTEGRHDFVTGARVCGPNVFYNCKAANTHADIGPHHRWSVGTLYDNITTDGEINVQDRGNWGSGHGWSGANQVLWNCKVKAAAIQNPWVSAKNWCIGLTGAQVPGRFSDKPTGEWEGLNQPGLTPASLYMAQKSYDKKKLTQASQAKSEPMAIKGRLCFEDDFKTPIEYTKDLQKVKDGYMVKSAHANWKQTNDGVQSIWEAGHMPVLVYSGNFGDAVIEVDFRFQKEEGKWAACRISATNTVLNPRAYAASVWANCDSKSRSLGMVLEHDEWKPGVITTVDTLIATFKPNKWYTLRLELIGNNAQATCNGVTVFGTHELFGIPKNSISLGVGTCKHELRNFRVYEATLNPKWNSLKP